MLRSRPLVIFVDGTFRRGIDDAHAVANLRRAVQEIFRVSDAEATGLTLNNELIRLAYNGAAIRAALGLGGECFGLVTEHIDSNRLRIPK
jgi:hypothetical protein